MGADFSIIGATKGLLGLSRRGTELESRPLKLSERYFGNLRHPAADTKPRETLGMTSPARGVKIDSIHMLMLFPIIALFVFIWRRWKELNAEIERCRHLEKELEHRATRDPLTELPNRTLLVDRLEHALERAARSKERVAVLFLDLDGFKEINDSFGHQAGDRLLKKVANRLQGCMRSADTVSRFGGDEFVILIEQMKDMNEVSQTAERILNTLTKPIDLGGREVSISASIGIACGAYSDSSLEDLLNRADAAMYQAKRRETCEAVPGDKVAFGV